MSRLKPPQGLNPEFFSLHQNSLQLPQYLGGKMLAPQKDPTIDYTAIASLLNGMKFLTINDLIQAIPLSDRLGDVDWDFLIKRCRHLSSSAIRDFDEGVSQG
ncbi:MAG: hypothetical protein ABI417_20515 [Coleofasciculaceae cyanobacterium]